ETQGDVGKFLAVDQPDLRFAGGLLIAEGDEVGAVLKGSAKQVRRGGAAQRSRHRKVEHPGIDLVFGYLSPDADEERQRNPRRLESLYRGIQRAVRFQFLRLDALQVAFVDCPFAVSRLELAQR